MRNNNRFERDRLARATITIQTISFCGALTFKNKFDFCDLIHVDHINVLSRNEKKPLITINSRYLF